MGEDRARVGGGVQEARPPQPPAALGTAESQAGPPSLSPLAASLGYQALTREVPPGSEGAPGHRKDPRPAHGCQAAAPRARMRRGTPSACGFRDSVPGAVALRLALKNGATVEQATAWAPACQPGRSQQSQPPSQSMRLEHLGASGPNSALSGNGVSRLRVWPVTTAGLAPCGHESFSGAPWPLLLLTPCRARSPAA